MACNRRWRDHVRHRPGRRRAHIRSFGLLIRVWRSTASPPFVANSHALTVRFDLEAESRHFEIRSRRVLPIKSDQVLIAKPHIP